MSNDMTGVYEPGTALTGYATAAIVGKRFVSITADRDAVSGNVKVTTTAAGARAHGVSMYDQPNVGGAVAFARGNSRVVTVTADNATIAAGVDVMVGANGTVKTWVTTNVAVGYAIANALANGEAQISLY